MTTAIAKRESIQRKKSTALIHASYYQQLQHVKITKRDKRWMVYLCYAISALSVLSVHLFLSWRHERIARARTALGQVYEQPADNLLLIILILTLCIALYAFLASFYRRVSVEYFLSTCVILLAAMPVFLGLSAWNEYLFQQERLAPDSRFLLSVLKAEIEQLQDIPADIKPERTTELSTSFSQVQRVTLTSPSSVWITCSRRTCIDFRNDKSQLQTYQSAVEACRNADYRELLQQNKKVIGQICINTQS